REAGSACQATRTNIGCRGVMAVRLCAVALVTLLGSAASAQSVAMIDTRPSLTWRAPAGCPDAASLRARVERRLERSLDEVVIRVEVDVARSAGRYVARVDLRAMTVANDVRTLTSTHCGELADAVAVIVTRVASDAIASRRVAVRDNEDPIAIAVESITVPSKPRVWTIGARLSGVSGIGVIPKVGLAGELAITVRRNDTLAEIAGTRWVASAAQFHD